MTDYEEFDAALRYAADDIDVNSPDDEGMFKKPTAASGVTPPPTSGSQSVQSILTSSNHLNELADKIDYPKLTAADRYAINNEAMKRGLDKQQTKFLHTHVQNELKLHHAVSQLSPLQRTLWSIGNGYNRLMGGGIDPKKLPPRRKMP